MSTLHTEKAESIITLPRDFDGIDCAASREGLAIIKLAGMRPAKRIRNSNINVRVSTLRPTIRVGQKRRVL